MKIKNNKVINKRSIEAGIPRPVSPIAQPEAVVGSHYKFNLTP